MDEWSSDGHFDTGDDDGDLLRQPPSSTCNSPSPGCANPAATDQSAVDLLTDDIAFWSKKLTVEECCVMVCKSPIQVSVQFPQKT